MAGTVIVIHPGAWGDVLLAVPALRRLRSRYTAHRIVLIAGLEVAYLLTQAGIADEWASWQGEPATRLFSVDEPLPARWQAWFDTCDYVVAWLEDKDEHLSFRLRALGGREAVVLSPFSGRLQQAHQSDRFLEIVQSPPMDPDDLGRPIDHRSFSGFAEEYLRQAGLPTNERFALIHPGSGSREKCIHPRPLVKLMEMLEGAGIAPWILEGPADRIQVDRLRTLCSRKPIIVSGINLATLAGVMAKAAMFVGHDSGPTHLAALLGLQTVALFGPTDSRRWGPRGRSVRILEGGPSFKFSDGEIESICRSILMTDLAL